MSDLILKEYKNINEKVYTKILDNGLKVIIIPKSGFNKYFASFTCEFGGNDYGYIDPNTKKEIIIPSGVAHFLEHKMFTMKNDDGSLFDVSYLFSNLGINANAYTDYLTTCYYIDGSKNFELGLNLLLDYVQTPCFIEKDVQKEKGIIIQEYKSYIDEPDEKISMKLRKNMYEKAYTKDIVGNIKDIKAINSNILNTAYDIFYHPSNMILSITGDVDPYQVIKLVEDNQNKKAYTYRQKPIHLTYKENKIVSKPKKIKIDSPIDIVKVGIRIDKDDYKENEAFIFESKINLILELLCGPISNNYQEMLDKDLITSFSYNIRLSDKMHPYIYFGTKTTTPEAFVRYIKKLIKNISKIEIKEEDFQLMKKGLLGQNLMATNLIEETVLANTDYLIRNSNLFECLDIFNNIKLEEVKEVLKYIKIDNLTYVIGKGSSD